MEVISYAKYLASPKYRKFPFKGLVGWIVGNFPPSVEDLQRKYNFTYYSTMGKAVTDVNNGTLANADANKNTAVAGVYTDKDGGKNVVLLKDTTEATRVSPTVDMTINLGGHTLSSNDVLCINVPGGNLVIDGRLPGSAIIQRKTDGTAARAVQVQAGGHATIVGGYYSTESSYTGVTACIYVSRNGAKLSVSSASIETIGTAGTIRGIAVYPGSVANVDNCNIMAICDMTTVDNGNVLGVSNEGGTTITNCDIRAYSNYHKDGDSYSARSSGVQNGDNGTLTINDCYVYGTHSGLSNHGTLYVNGGTYEGYGHGGIYFGGAGTTAYVRNATLMDSLTMPDGYTATSQHNGAGFYIGGSEGNDSIKVYMDNCKVYGSSKGQVIVLRGTSNEKNNSLYMSNSTIPEGSKIRIDNDTHKLYIGKGCNFTAENTTLPSAVIATDEVYVQGVA